jgi:hypothetical protein
VRLPGGTVTFQNAVDAFLDHQDLSPSTRRVYCVSLASLVIELGRRPRSGICPARRWPGWPTGPGCCSAPPPRSAPGEQRPQEPQLARLPDAELPASEPRAGGHRWLPDIQPPTLDRPAGVGGYPRADLIDHQPCPQGHHLWIDRDRLPGAGPARGRDPLARMAAHLKDAKLDPASAGRARQGHRRCGPGRARRRGRGGVRGAAGRQEDPAGDRAQQRNARRSQTASVTSADRHGIVMCAALRVWLAPTRFKPAPCQHS